MCKHVPNEMISIPSNKRTKWIHQKLFEKAGGYEMQSWYFTLDCKRWAPHSNLMKYIYFVCGLS
jgi:hypothetical protein